MLSEYVDRICILNSTFLTTSTLNAVNAHNINLRIILISDALQYIDCTVQHNINNALGKPNVVVFILDDMPFLEQWAESAPNGNNLEGMTVSLDPYPTPRIDEFRDEAVVFAKTYAASSKCAPSRISVLTGRQPVSCEFAIQDTLATRGLDNGIYGTSVTVMTEKMQGYDAENNIPSVLRKNGYFTGMVGKWHMMVYGALYTLFCIKILFI